MSLINMGIKIYGLSEIAWDRLRNDLHYSNWCHTWEVLENKLYNVTLTENVVFKAYNGQIVICTEEGSTSIKSEEFVEVRIL